MPSCSMPFPVFGDGAATFDACTPAGAAERCTDVCCGGSDDATLLPSLRSMHDTVGVVENSFKETLLLMIVM